MAELYIKLQHGTMVPVCSFGSMSVEAREEYLTKYEDLALIHVQNGVSFFAHTDLLPKVHTGR
jgi:hypothetical protein